MATYEIFSLEDYLKNLHQKLFNPEYKKLCETILSIRDHIDWKFLFSYSQFTEPLDSNYFWKYLFHSSIIQKGYSIVETDKYILKIPHTSTKPARSDPSPLLCYFENRISEAEWTFKR